jgi:hypothetical protein
MPPAPRTEPGTEQVLLDAPFTLAPGSPDSLPFDLQSPASSSVLRVVLDTGTPVRLMLHGPGECKEFTPQGSGIAPTVLVRSGQGMEKTCGPLSAGDYAISWEGEGYLQGRIIFRAIV